MAAACQTESCNQHSTHKAAGAGGVLPHSTCAKLCWGCPLKDFRTARSPSGLLQTADEEEELLCCCHGSNGGLLGRQTNAADVFDSKRLRFVCMPAAPNIQRMLAPGAKQLI
jgi:hypothetical protein